MILPFRYRRQLRASCSIISVIAVLSTTFPERAQASETQTGSGFYVSKQGHVLTNHHVINGCGRIEVELGGIRKNVNLIASDANNDIALLLDATPPTSVAVFRDGKIIRAGSDVIILGYPLYGALSREAIVTTGTISALAGIGNNAATFQLSAPTQPGNSGGPVLDASGTIVGMMFGMLDSIKGTKMTGQVPQNVNFAIHGAVVRTFLDAHNVPYMSRLPGSPRDRTDVVDEARRFTVLVHCYDEAMDSTNKFVDDILLKVFDREAPGWREIVFSEFEAWMKSQPATYAEALKNSRDPYLWAASLNDFMSSQRSKHIPAAKPDNKITSKRFIVTESTSPPSPQPAENHPPRANQHGSRSPSQSKELKSELDRELEELKKLSFVDSQETETATSGKTDVALATPSVRMKVPGAIGANQYLSRAQARISGMWNAPPVDISGKSLTVIVRFRIERDGRVSNVIIERSSGNEYYDLAARRAIQSAVPLPPFPPEMTESYLDSHFTFAVGPAPH